MPHIAVSNDYKTFKTSKKMKAKIQTNDHGTNVIVETQHSTNQHYWHGNRQCTIDKVLTDAEVVQDGKMFLLLMSDSEKVEFFKNLLKSKEGYATSNVSNCQEKHPNALPLKRGDIVKFSEK